jgi:hypothetical protein
MNNLYLIGIPETSLNTPLLALSKVYSVLRFYEQMRLTRQIFGQNWKCPNKYSLLSVIFWLAAQLTILSLMYSVSFTVKLSKTENTFFFCFDKIIIQQLYMPYFYD